MRKTLTTILLNFLTLNLFAQNIIDLSNISSLESLQNVKNKM